MKSSQPQEPEAQAPDIEKPVEAAAVDGEPAPRAAGDSAQIARLAPLAGREAMAAGANRQAADYLSIAVELADSQDEATLAALLFEAGEACRLVSRLRDAMAFFERAADVARAAGCWR